MAHAFFRRGLERLPRTGGELLVLLVLLEVSHQRGDGRNGQAEEHDDQQAYHPDGPPTDRRGQENPPGERHR